MASPRAELISHKAFNTWLGLIESHSESWRAKSSRAGQHGLRATRWWGDFVPVRGRRGSGARSASRFPWDALLFAEPSPKSRLSEIETECCGQPNLSKPFADDSQRRVAEAEAFGDERPAIWQLSKRSADNGIAG